jgi:hypothetical protein
MKKQNLLLIGALAVGGFFAWKKGLFGGGGSDETARGGSDVEAGDDDAGIDTVIDTKKTGQTVKQALQQAKELSKNVKDIAVLVKTPKGQSNIVVSSGKKKQERKAARKAKKAGRRDARLTKRYQAQAAANCASKKGARKKRCEIAKRQAIAWLAQNK